MEDIFHGIVVILVDFGKKDKIVYKEQVGDFWSPLVDLDRGPVFIFNLFNDISREPFHG